MHTKPLEVVLPSFVGMTKADALARIEELGLIASVSEKDLPGVAAGIVASQSPSKGTKVKAGGKVSLVVGTGGSGNLPPVPKFEAPATGKIDQAIAVDGSASSDDGSITTYLWEFGDGQTATGPTAKHAYKAAGTYEITLWVTDDRGEKASLTKSIKVL